MNASKPYHAPASQKIQVLLVALGAEIDALEQAHGVECNCDACWVAGWSRPGNQASRSYFRGGLARNEAAEVAAVRQLLTKRLGSSDDPGTIRDMPKQKKGRGR